MKKRLLPALLLLSCTAHVLAFEAKAIGNSHTGNLYDSRTCNELYMQASALEQETYLEKHDFYTSRDAQVAGVAATLFAPAIYYFGYAAYKDVESKFRARTALQEIDAIRHRMAEKRCFDR